MKLQDYIKTIKFYNDSKLDLSEIRNLISFLHDNDININYELLYDVISSSSELKSILNNIKDSDNNIINMMLEINDTLKLEEDLKKSNDTVISDSTTMLLRESTRYKLLTREEEIELAKKIALGDKEAKKKLAEHNVRLAASIAKHYCGRGLEYEDLVQCAMLGLMTATEKFDYTKGYKFSTYATWWIKQSLVRELYNTADSIRLPVHVQEIITKIDIARRQLVVSLGYDPSNQEIANYLKMDVNVIDDIDSIKYSMVSAQTPIGEDNDYFLEDTLEDNSLGTEDNVIYSLEKQEINNILAILKEKERNVLIMAYGLNSGYPMTLQAIGDYYGISRERVRQIKDRAINKLKQSYKAKSLIEYVDFKMTNPNVENRQKNKGMNIYQILSKECTNKEIINKYISELDDYDKNVIDIIYGKDLDNPMKDLNRYSLKVTQQLYSNVLPKLRKRLKEIDAK